MLTSPTHAPWNKVSPLEILITRACEPSLHEPNYALHIEIAEYIKTKKANTPREAAMLLARLANHRNPHVALLALSLLDTLVQSCGYPFHLQISTKEFLNELVRRFPEHPTLSLTPVMSRVLEMINGWKEGICAESRWKEDLGNIRDMHRLLMYKGYRFREQPRQQSLASATNIKSAEELEEEDRAAQSAKLQELIRRGTPRDLAAAQELMKSLAGANPDAKPDYRAQSLNELNKLEQKVILMNEMLDNFDVARSERFAEGDAYDQVASILTNARPKIQKWISAAETDDPESLDTFLQINDQINTVLSRYEAFKKGDYTAAANPIPAELASSGSQALSLIDFDEGQEAGAQTTAAGGISDLADLFAAPPSQPMMVPGGSGFARNVAQPSAPTTTYASPTPLAYNGSNLFAGNNNGRNPAVSPPHTVTPPASIMLPSTPQQQPQQRAVVSPPNYFSSNTVNQPKAPGLSMGVMQAQRSTPQQQQQQQQMPATTIQAQGKDPFADLAGLF
ncbi:hypothetical protein AMATHDRAFT_58708 [Amanita thiersii Skay4041]|uniref:VHS domain-containing protein n=1 Tax=Amanita thiersii Skay4041 TaxID=703135 RepID=A0A2A9NQK9_9AGAR|nr:hypothetical protein AMATHDRAFT_58708 [Amanita thiersii Skay4041]